MKPIALILFAAVAVSCSGGDAAYPTSPTPMAGNPHLGPTQTYDMHPAPGADPEPGADPAPPSPVPEPVPGEPMPEPAPETPVGPTPTPTSTFDGTYTGTAGSGNDHGSDRWVVTVANGVASFTVGSGGPIPGTVSGTGAIAASGGECNATITGQITITASGVATASGTWSHPAVVCGESANSGRWTATR